MSVLSDFVLTYKVEAVGARSYNAILTSDAILV